MIKRSNSASGVYLLKRAVKLAERIRQRFGNSREIVDGYIIEGRRNGERRYATVIDVPGSVVTNPRPRFPAYYQVGVRDNYANATGEQDGPYNIQATAPSFGQDVFYAHGFDPATTDRPNLPAPWPRAYPITLRDMHWAKRDLVRCSGLIRYPILSNQLPFPSGSEIFSGVYTLGPAASSTPGHWWTNDAIRALTGGYDLARIADMFPLEFGYQGDAPVSAAHGQVTLVVTPLLKNGPVSRDEGVAFWGESAVRFALIQAGTDGGPSTELWSRVWKPDEHSCTFFHNGPWLARPDIPSYSNMVPPKPASNEAWDAWWLTHDAGGSRPNRTECLSAVWFNGRFVVQLRVAAINGAFTPASGDNPSRFRTAAGTAHMRFDVGLDGMFSPTEVSYDIWNAPEQYAGVVAGTPYAEWVSGVLDDTTVHADYPAALLSTPSQLVEVTLCTNAARRSVRQLPFASQGWRYIHAADLAADRLEVKVTPVMDDGEEGPPVTHKVYFEELGCGIDAPRLLTYDVAYRIPPLGYVYRACDAQVAMVSAHELGFLATQEWRGGPGAIGGLLYVVLDLNTGVASVRGDTGLQAQWADDHVLAPHLDCVQRALYNEQGEVTMHSVLLATTRTSAATHISRDSGATWVPYLTNHVFSSGYSPAAYFVGNPLGGGAVPGRAVI